MKVVVDSEAALIAFGRQLGAILRGGECIELIGDVGAGKTTLTKGIADGMGSHETVQSPTFTISRQYTTSNNLRLVHYDFYRLQDAGIMQHDIAEAIHDPQTVTVVEWSDAVKGVLPQKRIQITLTATADDNRILVLEADREFITQLPKDSENYVPAT